MVTFDRRYRSDRKGYWRESVKRDTEAELAEEVEFLRSVRPAPGTAPEDRGIAELIFRSEVAPESRESQIEPLEIEVEAEPVGKPSLTQRVMILLKRAFGPNY